MTEEEAKTKWCPFARVTAVPAGDGEPSASYNRMLVQDQDSDGGAKIIVPFRAAACLGSACMAWRWRDDAAISGKGYCGLAGKP